MSVKPLNVWSLSDEPVGRAMSNFAHTPFTLDGVEYGSVESFYASSLIAEPERKADTRRMYGIVAKRRIPKRKPEFFEYHGRTVALGSAEHHALVERAIRAKLEAHPEIAREFVATRPRPIIHDTGYEHDPAAEFPHAAFCGILERLREEFAAAYRTNS